MNVTVTAGGVGRDHSPQLSAAPSSALQLLGVWLGPFAWAMQLDINYAIASYPCFYHGAARVTALPGWGASWVWVLVVNLAAIALTLAGAAIGWRAVRWSRARSVAEERHSRVVSRTYALGVAALLFSATFFLATVVALIAIIGAPLCPI